MKAVENVPAAVAQYAMAPDAQESPGGGVVVEDGDVLVHQEHIRRNSIQQLAEQDFVAHLCDWDTHVGSFFTFWVDCQHHSAPRHTILPWDYSPLSDHGMGNCPPQDNANRIAPM